MITKKSKKIIVKNLVEKLIETGKEEKLPMLPIDEFENIINEMGFDTHDYDYDTNGWQVYFRFTYKHNSGDKYMLSGSLFYGRFRFSKL